MSRCNSSLGVVLYPYKEGGMRTNLKDALSAAGFLIAVPGLPAVWLGMWWLLAA